MIDKEEWGTVREEILEDLDWYKDDLTDEALTTCVINTFKGVILRKIKANKPDPSTMSADSKNFYAGYHYALRDILKELGK